MSGKKKNQEKTESVVEESESVAEKGVVEETPDNEEKMELTVLDGGAGIPGTNVAAKLDSPEEVAAWKLRQEIQEIVQQMGDNMFSLSEKLFEVYSHMTYLKWGYKTWREYVESEIQFKLRKAQYYVSIWNWFGNLPQVVRDKVMVLGWSKVSVLVGVVDEDNVDEWVALAKEMTHEQLILEAKKFLKPPEEEESSGDSGAEKVGRLTFVLFDEQREVVENALEHAQEMSESDKKGNNLSLICQDFLTSNSDEMPTPDVLLGRIERFTGISLIGVRMEDKKIVYGEKVLDKILEEGKKG